MAKDKTKSGVPNRHLHARTSYLQQAATYLATASTSTNGSKPGTHATQGGNLTRKTAGRRASEGRPTTSPTSVAHPETNITSEPHGDETRDSLVIQQPSFGGLPLLLASHLAQVARKSQIRLHPSVKHTLCKRCNSPLVEGRTCRKTVENLSKSRKPHADVLVLQCLACGAEKRWPVGTKRQERKTKRARNTEKPECTSFGATAVTEGT